jgi:hypothetical protein
MPSFTVACRTRVIGKPVRGVHVQIEAKSGPERRSGRLSKEAAYLFSSTIVDLSCYRYHDSARRTDLDESHVLYMTEIDGDRRLADTFKRAEALELARDRVETNRSLSCEFAGLLPLRWHRHLEARVGDLRWGRPWIWIRGHGGDCWLTCLLDPDLHAMFLIRAFGRGLHCGI